MLTGGLAARLARAGAAAPGVCRAARRDYVTPEDVKAVRRPVLAHRVTVQPELWMSAVTGRSIVEAVLGSVPTPTARELRAEPPTSRP